MTTAYTPHSNRSDAPQSRVEVEPVERALRQLDDRIRIEWDPKAIMVRRNGGYDAMGKVKDPEYEGRWAIVIDDPALKTAAWREKARITYVTAPVTERWRGLERTVLHADGPYAPIGMWLVEVMQSWDRANRDLRDLRDRLDAMNAAVDAAALAAGEDVERERLEQMYFTGTQRGGVSALHPVARPLTPSVR